MKIISVLFVFLSFSSFSQIDMALIQTGWNEERKTYYLEGEKLQSYLDTLAHSPIIHQETQGEKFCVEKVWFSYEGNTVSYNVVCSLEDLRIKPFWNDLRATEISIKEVTGYKNAMTTYDSLRSENVKFQVSPSILSENKFELREMAYFEDTLDPNEYSSIEMDSIYYYDFYLPAYSKLRKSYKEIDSMDFLFSPWIKNELIVVIFPTNQDLNLKPFRKLGIQFKETPIIEQRKYRFAIFKD